MIKFCDVRPTECYCNNKGCSPVEDKNKKNEKQKKKRMR